MVVYFISYLCFPQKEIGGAFIQHMWWRQLAVEESGDEVGQPAQPGTSGPDYDYDMHTYNQLVWKFGTRNEMGIYAYRPEDPGREKPSSDITEDRSRRTTIVTITCMESEFRSTKYSVSASRQGMVLFYFGRLAGKVTSTGRPKNEENRVGHGPGPPPREPCRGHGRAIDDSGLISAIPRFRIHTYLPPRTPPPPCAVWNFRYPIR